MRFPANKGQHCTKWGRKRGRLYCKKFSYPKRRGQIGFPPGHTPANYGAACTKYKSVWSPWYNKKVWRCARFAGGRSRKLLQRNGSGNGDSRPIRVRTPPRPLPPAPRQLPTPRQEGYIPLSLPSMERSVVGRTPLLLGAGSR